MNILARVANALSGKTLPAISQKAAALPPALPPEALIFFNMLDMAPPAGAQSNLTPRLAYRRDNLAYACMQFRATKLTEPPLWIADETEEGLEWLKGEHALSKVLEQPNPDMDISEFLNVVSLLMDIDGECLIVKARDSAGRTAVLWPYHRELYRVERTTGRLHGKFIVSTEGGRQETLVPEDVIYLREPDPVDPYRSVSRVQTALAKINLSQDLVTTIRQIMRRGVNPGGIFSFKDPLSAEQKDSVRSEIANRLAGVHNAGGAMVLDGEVTYTAPTVSLKDMTTGPAQYDCEAAICQAFQIHPMLVGAKVGLESSAGFADSLAPALKLFYDISARPAWRRIERKFTQGLLREIDPNPRRFIKFDLAEVQAFQESMLERAQTVTAAREVMTVDEGRLYLDLDPLEDERGEKLIAEASRPDPSLFGLGGGFGAPSVTEDEKGRKARRSSLDGANRYIIGVTRQALREAHEFTIQLAAQNALIQDRDDILAILKGETKGTGALSEEGALSIIARLLKHTQSAVVERWQRLVRPTLEAAGRHAVHQAAAELSVSFNLLQPGLLEFIEKESGFLITSVSETTRKAVVNAIREGVAAGESIPQIADRITALGEFGAPRAELIARTEVTRATNGAQRASLSDYAKTSGNRAFKVWLNSNDDRVRDAHENGTGVGGERRPIDEPFSNGLMEPSEPNCRCSLILELEEAA